MVRSSLNKLAFLLLLGCSAQGVQAEENPRPIAPTLIEQPDGSSTLAGWKDAPAPHSTRRMIVGHEGYSRAMVVTIENMPLDFRQGLETALSKEGLSEVGILAKQDITGELPTVFSRTIDNPQGQYATFSAVARGPRGPVKIVGLWLQTPLGDDAGSTYEMFIAAPEEYRALGGWFVPSAYYFTDFLPDPSEETVIEFGSHNSSEAANNLAERFGVFMQQIISGKQLDGMMQQQTLSIQLGLDQTEGYGLQDPMYGW